jgi:UDP-GlcNAc3NAcA epimerase
VRIVCVIGTRPQLIKAAVLLPALASRHQVVFVDTGQHWSERLAGAFFAELGLPEPDHALGIGGDTHAMQTGRMLLALDPILAAERPDAVLVFGDTNSTLAGALGAAKRGIPVAHVEAGLRSHDRRMPEELNRVVADHLSTWLFAPTPTAVDNLAAEGITRGVLATGDLMHELAATVVPEVADRDALELATRAVRDAGAAELDDLQVGSFIYATVHRAENREPQAIAGWSSILADAARPDRPVILALHPGTRAALADAGATLPEQVIVVEPLGYRTSLTLQLHAAAVLTDSGGVQREAAWLGTPCLVLRDTTEWVEAVASSDGSMVVVGLDRERAWAELDRLAPPDAAPRRATMRAANLAIRSSGEADRITAALEAVPTR